VLWKLAAAAFFRVVPERLIAPGERRARQAAAGRSGRNVSGERLPRPRSTAHGGVDHVVGIAIGFSGPFRSFLRTTPSTVSRYNPTALAASICLTQSAIWFHLATVWSTNL
jgi:hypothetical protein